MSISCIFIESIPGTAGTTGIGLGIVPRYQEPRKFLEDGFGEITRPLHTLRAEVQSGPQSGSMPGSEGRILSRSRVCLPKPIVSSTRRSAGVIPAGCTIGLVLHAMA